MDLLYDYQRDLLAGHTEWVADQNRVLAPLLILAFQKCFHAGYESAYQHLMFALFVAQTLSAAILFRRCELSLGQVVIGLLLVTTVPLALMNLWWFPWTNLEFMIVLLVFLVDASRVRITARVLLYTGLFTAWTLTKETSFLLSIWIALRYGLPALVERRWKTLGQLALVCTAMVVVSAGVISGLRQWLWVSGTNANFPTGMPSDTPTVLAGTHLFSLNPINIARMLKNYRGFLTLHSPWPLWNNGHFNDWSVGMIEMLVALAITTICMVWALSHRSLRMIGLAAMALIYVMVLFVFTNPLEADKLMPAVAIGAYAYALMTQPRRGILTDRLP